MKKVNSFYNQFNNKKKAFTLIELLIVIAIIGILFIVLVSKVDFATDKAKATGVQTDFRSFQMAFDTVAKENAGFNTFGFDTGDNAGAIPDGYAFESTEAENKTKGDGIRNSYDQGDKNLNGKQDVNGKDGYTGTTEVFTGRKIYTEKWTDVWTLVKPGTSGYDADAIFALESAINKNLDPKLHITIAADGKITMANQARDPWKNEYHGYYITNAEVDKGDRGAIVMYSNGANGKWGSAHVIENGVVTVGVPGNNVDGKDDYSFVSCYTFVNGYGEVLNATTGFSNNQGFQGAGINNAPSVVPGGNGGNSNGNSGSGQSTLTNVTLGGTYVFKSTYNVDTIFDIALQSNSIDIDPEIGMANCLLVTGGREDLTIMGFDPSQRANSYAIMIEKSNETYGYISQGMIEFLLPLDPIYASLNNEGWYVMNNDGISKCSNVPNITFDIGSNVYVSNLNVLLPLFSSGNSGNAGTGSSGNLNNQGTQATEVVLGGIYSFKNFISYDVAKSIASKSSNRDTSSSDAIASIVLQTSTDKLTISYLLNADGFMIMYESSNKTLYYFNRVVLDMLEGSDMQEGWYDLSNGGALATSPKINIAFDSEVFVPNINDLLPLFELSFTDPNMQRPILPGEAGHDDQLTHLAPGLYDIYDNQLASWDELVNKYGLSVSKDFYEYDVKRDTSSLYYIINNNDELYGAAKLKIDNSITKIGDWAFRECSQIKCFVIGNNVSVIGNGAFYECTGWCTNLVLPNSVRSIGDGSDLFPGQSFYGCVRLKSVTLNNGLQEIYESSFEGCTSLTGALIIPNSVTFLDESAFRNCSSLSSLQLGTGLTTIETSVFAGCSGFKGALIIPSNITNIETSAFAECSGFTTLQLPDTIQQLGWSVFEGCSGLTGTLTIPNSITYLGSSVFEGCSGLTAVVFNATSITTIPQSLFQACTSLQNVQLHNNVVIIEQNAFQESGLKTINFPASLREIRSMAFYKCTSLSGNLEFNEGLTTIGFDAFGYCESITGVKLPNSLTSLEGRAFEFCTSITSFIFGSGITSLESNAVRGLHSLEYLYLPATITSVQGFGIYECENLKTLVIASETRISFPQYTLESCPSIERICVPEDLVDDYQNYFSNSSLHGRLADTIEAI